MEREAYLASTHNGTSLGLGVAHSLLVVLDSCFVVKRSVENTV